MEAEARSSPASDCVVGVVVDEMDQLSGLFVLSVPYNCQLPENERNVWGKGR